MAWLAPSATAFASLSSELEVMITSAPRALANCSPKIETPPVPWHTTTSPARTEPDSASAFQAVSAAHGRVAASSKLRYSGNSKIGRASCRERVYINEEGETSEHKEKQKEAD